MRYCCGSVDLRGENFTSNEEREITGRIQEFFRGLAKLEQNFCAGTVDIIIDDRDWPHTPSNGDYQLIVLSKPNKSIHVRLRPPRSESEKYRVLTAPPPEWLGEAMRSPKKPVAPVTAPPTRSKKLLLI